MKKGLHLFNFGKLIDKSIGLLLFNVIFNRYIRLDIIIIFYTKSI